MGARNPFKPGFGVSPPLLVGRDEAIDEFSGALEDGPGSSGRATLYTGARGGGKTVLLNEIEDRARSRGWLVVSETATRGVVNRLTQSRLPELLRELDPEAVKRRLTGFTIPVSGGGVDWATLETHVAKIDLRRQIEQLTDILADNEAGLLITLDEIHRGPIEDLRELATVVQHAFREERELAFGAAGLTASVSNLLSDEVLTFLRRADRYHLGPVQLDEVRRALKEPIEANGREVGTDALDAMVDATQGYPFLIQLVGSRCWRVQSGRKRITLEDVRVGIENARLRLGSLVHAPALSDASDIDKSFLLAMARDDGASRLSDISERLGVDTKYASVYRSRLIDAELIEPAGRGLVDFALPYLRDYLREHVASGI